MDIFDILTLLGGLCLFLFGMSVMGQALERSAGGGLERMLGKLTSNRWAGLMTGLGITAVIQSSSATTVMVVGFVNSGLMNLRQAIHVIMGANIGTTVTAWILSLGGISGDSPVLKLLKPMSFTPLLALVGLVLFMGAKSRRKKDIGTIFLGFAVLMFGMDSMTNAVSGLAEVPAFRELFILFSNPILGVLVGAVLTAAIQSSSASVGILQAFAATGQISYGAAVPIIMGQNIGTCITAILASFGTNKNAKRTSLVHLAFNIIGTAVWLSLFCLVDLIVSPAILGEAATMSGIATVHSLFNLASTALLFPMSGLLEKLAYKLVPETREPDTVCELDERLLATPAIALQRCRDVAADMAQVSTQALMNSLRCLRSYDADLAASIREAEGQTDHYEDIIGTFLVRISSQPLNDTEGATASMLLKVIGDLERISDHAVNVVESAEEMRDKGIAFTEAAQEELSSLCEATEEIVTLSHKVFTEDDLDTARYVEPLEQVIDRLKEYLRGRHIERLRRGECSIEAGFVWSDLITNMERVSDHCSNIAGCVMDARAHSMQLHEHLRLVRSESVFFEQTYQTYVEKYAKFS